MAILSDLTDAVAAERVTQAQALIALAADVDLSRDVTDETYATVTLDGRRETWVIRARSRARGLAALLRARYYAQEDRPPSSQAVTDAVSHLEAHALLRGPVRQVYVRVAEVDTDDGPRVYVDLADDAGHCVEIGPDGWAVLDAPPADILFLRPRGALPLPLPVRGGRLADLRRLLPAMSDTDWMRCVGWTVGAYHARRPLPVLCVTGEQGAGKSTLCRMVIGLVDPSEAPLRRLPREEMDLHVQARYVWVLGLDNVTYIDGWLSDALASIATGAGWAGRKYHTDDDVTISAALRPLVLNGIGDIVPRDDLRDRCLSVHLPAMGDDAHRPEDALWRDYYALRPALLGAIYDSVSTALRRLPGLHLPHAPRMADHACWIAAAEPALPWDPPTDPHHPSAYLDMLAVARRTGRADAVEGSPVARAVRDLAAEAGADGWTGTLGGLLDVLDGRTDDATRHRRGWPGTPRALRTALEREAPALRGVGVTVEIGEHGRTGRTVTITRAPVETAGDRHDRHIVTALGAVGAPRDGGRDGGDDMGSAPSRVTVGASAPSPPSRPPSRLQAMSAKGCDGGDGGDGATPTVLGAARAAREVELL